MLCFEREGKGIKEGGGVPAAEFQSQWWVREVTGSQQVFRARVS